MFQVNPGETTTIFRQLADPFDSTIYYVRAVIKNASGAVIATKDLTDNGGQFFSADWQVPQTPNPTWFVVITSVYTDSGYTTKSPNYAQEALTGLISQRWNHAIGGSGGGGSDINYDRLMKMFRQVAKEMAKEFPEAKEIDLAPMMDMMGKEMTALHRKLVNLDTKIVSAVKAAVKTDTSKFEEQGQKILDVISKLPDAPIKLEPSVVKAIENYIKDSEKIISDKGSAATDAAIRRIVELAMNEIRSFMQDERKTSLKLLDSKSEITNDFSKKMTELFSGGGKESRPPMTQYFKPQ